MPGGAPPPMQFTPLQYAQPNMTTASALKGLGQNLASASQKIPGLNTPAAPPGADTTGQPGSPYAGPVPPGAGVNTGVAGTGLPGNPYAGPVMPGQGAPGANPLPTPQNPYPNGPVGTAASNMQPAQLLAWLKSTLNPGQGTGSMMPGSAALQGAGMLAPTINNPSAMGGA